MKEILKKIVITLLTAEAQLLLKRMHPTIISVTGSVGKTSTKDAIFAVIKNTVHARKSEKSYNSDIGVALTVLGLAGSKNNLFVWVKNIFDGAVHALFSREYPEVLVLEMGVDRPGDMKRLTQWIKPDIVVVTRLPDVPAHVEYFDSPQQVIDEKMILVSALKPEGVFIYNNDDEKIRPYVEATRQQSFGFSRYSPSHFTASGDTIAYKGNNVVGMQFMLEHLHESAKVQIHGSVGIQHTYTCAAAAAVGSQFAVTLQEAAQALGEMTPPQGRMRLVPGINDTTFIDDTYNSSPVACEHALQTLSEIKTEGRHIAVLGDMLELGQYSVREHERMGECASTRVDVLITLGVRAQKIAEGALAYGLNEEAIFQYDDIHQLIAELRPMLKKGDVVLVKASQGVRAEKIVKELMAEPENAKELLVRQDGIWEGM